MKFEWDEDKAAVNLRKHGVHLLKQPPPLQMIYRLRAATPITRKVSIVSSLLAYHLQAGYWLSLM